MTVAAAREQFDAVFDAVDAAGFDEFFEGDGAGRVETALVDPGLDAVEVDGGDLGCESVFFGECPCVSSSCSGSSPAPVEICTAISKRARWEIWLTYSQTPAPHVPLYPSSVHH